MYPFIHTKKTNPSKHDSFVFTTFQPNILQQNKAFGYVLVFGTLVLPVVVSVWIVVVEGTNLVFLVLDFGAEGSDVSSKDHLLRGTKLAEAALDLFGDWTDHGEYDWLVVDLLVSSL